MLIDTHCHIDLPDFDKDREDVLNTCCTDGINPIINPGVFCKDWNNLLGLAAKYPIIKTAIGLHPCYIEQHSKNDIEALEQIVSSNNSIIALGEIGLDLYGNHPDIDEQKWYFSEQVKIAKKYNMPIIVHARKSHDLVLKTIRQLHFQNGGTIHAFSGSLQQAQSFINLRFKLGFGGTITYERAKRTREVLQQIPLQAIVLETDAPFMPPYQLQGIRNTPINLRMILKCAAELRDIPKEELEEITYNNSMEVFGLDE
ncbi:MAG: TatD family deoxyribonuclease [Gammaproteobacteria bacterium]|nr:MAG: TatD family deoxyribonuclease [Gammaproteobacteria bacterium]